MNRSDADGESIGPRPNQQASSRSDRMFHASDTKGHDFTSLCTFWIGECCVGINTRFVGEVVTVEDFIQIPMTAQAVLGIFNLRGEPVPLVSLAAVLDLNRFTSETRKTLTVIVLRVEELVVGLIADRMETVISIGHVGLTPGASGNEDENYLGFFEPESDSVRTVVSVLNPETLIRKLLALRHLKPTAS